MTMRVGIDLVTTASVRESLAAHGNRYLERVFTSKEVTDCSPGGTPDAARLAARFAAKEATFKVLRVGDRAVSWRDVEVDRDASGSVRVVLFGGAFELARTEGIARLSLSFSHAGGRAAAVVVAEIDEPADK
jgi:holo-[acyl-carrier protein] synthase